MGQPTISFIIPTIDRRDYLLGCLRSIAAQLYPHKEIIVVDDNSQDGTQEAVLAEFPETIYIRNPGRGGIGPALMQGAEKSSGDIFVNLDDDGYLADPDAGDKIISYFKTQPDLAAICFKVEDPEGFTRRSSIPFRHKKLPTTDTDVGLFLGGAVAFRKSALMGVGGYPDVEFYAWEQDVAVRFIKAGYRILFTPSIVFTHLYIPSPQNTTHRESGYLRIRMRLAATYLPAPYAQVHALLWIAFSLIASARKGDLRHTARTTRDSIHEWPSYRADGSKRLSLAEARRLSRLSGRTWY